MRILVHLLLSAAAVAVVGDADAAAVHFAAAVELFDGFETL